MKKHVSIVAAAALALGGVSFAIAQETAAPPGNPQPQTKTEKVEQGVRNEAAKIGIGSADKASEKMTPHAEQIHDVLAQVAEAAFSKNGVKDVAERLSKADRDRRRSLCRPDWTGICGSVQQNCDRMGITTTPSPGADGGTLERALSATWHVTR